MVSRPLYGLPGHPYYNVLPVLHEPGPIATSWLTSGTGISVLKGERLRVTSAYDGERPHVRVMGIWHLYLAPDRSVKRGCPRLPRDLENGLPSVPGRTEPPAVTVPLTELDQRGRAITIDRPAGPMIMGGPETDVRVDDLAYRVRNLSIPLDATVRWHFHGSAYHDVTLANGPVGFASRWSLKGDTFSRRFTEPGTYRLFCSLHPIAMTQVIDVGATR